MRCAGAASGVRAARAVDLREVVREALYGIARNRFRAGAVDARHLVGHRLGRDAARLRRRLPQALDAGFRGAFCDGTAVVLPGQTSLQAGGERAGKRVQVDARRRRGDRRAAAREATPAPSSCGGCRWCSATSQSQPSAAWRRLRRDAQRARRGRAGRFLDDEDVRGAAASRSSAAKSTRKLFGNRTPVGETDAHRGAAVRSRSACMDDKVQMSNYMRAGYATACSFPRRR